MRANFARKIEELQRIQRLLKDAKRLVEKELGRKVLDAYLQGKGEREIYQLVRHIVSDVYGYDRIHALKQQKAERMKKQQEKQALHQNQEGVVSHER